MCTTMMIKAATLLLLVYNFVVVVALIIVIINHSRYYEVAGVLHNDSLYYGCSPQCIRDIDMRQARQAARSLVVQS